MRLIDADALMEYCLNQKKKTVDCNDIARFPSAQPKRMKGHWIAENRPSCFTVECDRCRYMHVFKEKPLWKANYCPNCGAEMETL